MHSGNACMNECPLCRLRESRQKETREARSERRGGEKKKSTRRRRRKKKKRRRNTRPEERESGEREDCSFSNDSGEQRTVTCTRRGGPFLALTWPYVAPSSLGLSDLTWSFFRSGFSPRGAPNPPFLSACARKWLRRPNMAAPFALSSAKKGSNPGSRLSLVKASPYQTLVLFSLFQTHPLCSLIARIKKYSSADLPLQFEPWFLLHSFFAGGKKEIYLSIVFPGHGEKGKIARLFGDNFDSWIWTPVGFLWELFENFLLTIQFCFL